jgi:hypothetical protein
MSEYQVIYWRDIPVQVRVREGTERLTRALPDRFQQAHKRAAFRAKAITGVAYMTSWNSTEWQEHPADLERALLDVMSEIDSGYSEAKLNAIIFNKGYKEDTIDGG